MPSSSSSTEAHARGPRQLVVWRLSDGTRGHDNQSRGLLEAIGRLTPVEAHELPAPACLPALADWVTGRAPDGVPDGRPDLVLGAGHRTHAGLLATRRACGGRSIVLMRPTLPLALFDLALVPRHDDPPVRANVETTVGALNPMRPGTARDPELGVVLIGGPSRHHDWDEVALLAQIGAIAAAEPRRRFVITDSRRTPDGTRARLAAGITANAVLQAAATTGPDWLPGLLARAPVAWVTADSVSMIHEALTAGCQVGVLEVPQRTAGRVGRGLEALVAEGRVTPFARWRADGRLPPAPAPLAEADRCARLVLARWYPERLAAVVA